MERLTEQRIGELEKMHGASPAGVLMVATPVPEEFGQPPYGIMRHLGGDQIRCEATVQNKSLADSFAALHNNFPSLAAEARKGLLAEKYRKVLEEIGKSVPHNPTDWCAHCFARQALTDGGTGG